MAKTNYSDKEISWALEELKKKGVIELTRERAIKLLDSFKEFGKVLVGNISKGKKVKEN